MKKILAFDHHNFEFPMKICAVETTKRPFSTGLYAVRLNGPGRSGPRSHDKMPNAHSPMNFGLIRSNRQIGIFGLDTSLSGRVSVCKDPGVSLCQVHKISISKPFFTRWQAKHWIAVYSQACASKAISCKRLRSTFKCENNETLSPDLFMVYSVHSHS